MKKLLTILITLALAVTMLAMTGCGAADTEPISDDNGSQNEVLSRDGLPEDALTSDCMKINVEPDYDHTDDDAVYLGTGEGAILHVQSLRTDARSEDIWMEYDEALVNIEELEPIEEEDTIVFRYRITMNEPCETDLFITTTYENETLGDDAMGFWVDLVQLDDDLGRIVYTNGIAPGYHFDKSCAGEGAAETTLWDAEERELEPCEKCAE